MRLTANLITILAILRFVSALYMTEIQRRQSAGAACDFGAAYLACADGQTGCFTNIPDTSRACKPACPSDAKTATISQPIMFSLLPSEPDRAQPPICAIEVESQNKTSVREQAIVFEGIPKAAKSCVFKWAQAAQADRDFHVQDSGLISIEHLIGFPPAGDAVSAASIKPFELPSAKFNLDFTNWDKIEAATTHIGSQINCSEAVYFKAALNQLNGDGHVHFEQDQHNGLFIEYSC